jgi:hypothetical protein
MVMTIRLRVARREVNRIVADGAPHRISDAPLSPVPGEQARSRKSQVPSTPKPVPARHIPRHDNTFHGRGFEASLLS